VDWVRGALEKSLAITNELECAAIALHMLGTRHGRLSQDWFRDELDAAICRGGAGAIKRIWLMAG
jgi:hypothetical protein